MTPQQKENLQIGAIALGAGIGLYFLFGKSNPNGTPDPAVNDIPTTSSFNAQNVADDLKAAMLVYSGTDETAILDALKYVTPAQFSLVAKAFGSQSYNTLYGNQWNFNPFGDLPLLPLKTWLKEELSTAEYNILKNKYINQL